MHKFLFLFLSLLPLRLSAQEVKTIHIYPDSDFRQPLDLIPSLSGSFGEIRSSHFHSGMDYRTNQREGYPVYAVADGFVSRLRVQVGGFGNAVYISHPNGYTSVYAHLQRFNPLIARTAKNYQYRQQAFDVDFLLQPADILVKKGEIIAWSGNTGSSGGPHLHFEIRDSKTEEIINPQLFGLDIPDKVKPVIKGLYAYRLNGLPFSEKTPKQYFQVIGSAGKYYLNKSPVINLSGEVGFGITTYDQSIPSGNQNGVYSIELKVDQQSIYLSTLERFFFNHTRATNSFIDYPSFLNSGLTIQKSFTEPGNPLTIYQTLVNNGIVKLTDDQVHNIEYTVKDIRGNASTLVFKVKYNPGAIIPTKEITGAKKFFYNQLNEFSSDAVKISIPIGSLYSDLDFTYSVSKKAGAYSALHQVHTQLIPVNESYNLWIKPDSALTPDLRAKSLIIDTKGKSYGGTFENGYVKTTSGSFGNFYVTLDTIAPIIRPVNIVSGKSMAGLSKMTFKISDNLSGIQSFTGTIDGQWVLMEFDQKTATLWHTFDERTQEGKHTFQLDVTDKKLNKKTYTAIFYR